MLGDAEDSDLGDVSGSDPGGVDKASFAPVEDDPVNQGTDIERHEESLNVASLQKTCLVLPSTFLKFLSMLTS